MYVLVTLVCLFNVYTTLITRLLTWENKWKSITCCQREFIVLSVFLSYNLSWIMTAIEAQRLLKYLLRFLTLHGLSPFIFTCERSVFSVRTPKRLLIYSVVVSILINCFIISWAIYCVNYTFQIYQDDPIVFLTVTFEYIFGLTNGIALFTVHNSHHIKIAKMIKQAMKLSGGINKFTASSTTMLNKRVKKIIKIKMCAVVLQILAILLTYPAQTFSGWMLYSYPQLLIMLTGIIYIFGFMMLSLNSIICINAKLKFIQKSIRYSHKTSATVTWSNNYIDELSVLFNVVNKFTISLNGLYGWNFTLTLVGSTVLILCSVKF